MPLCTFIDDIIFDGEEETFDKLVFYSTFYALCVLNIEYELRSNPPHFYPTSQDPEVIRNFNECYRLAFDSFLPYVQANEPLPPFY